MFEEPPSPSGEIVPIRPSSYEDTQRQRKIPPAVAKLIADLGDRFPPTSQTDLESHARRLALLAQDLWDMPPDILAKAIDRYVKIPGNYYLPKASQLVEIGRAICTPPVGSVSKHGIPNGLHEYAAWLNERNFSKAYRWEYFVARTEDGREYIDKRQHQPSGGNDPTAPLTAKECGVLANAAADSPARAIFNMGRNIGWIVADGESWIDSALKRQ